jgi:hypothetical protein
MDPHTADDPVPVTLPRLWFGVFAAPTAWVAALLLGYLSSAAICRSRDAASGTLLILLAGMLALALAGLIVAFANWRSLRQRSSATNIAPWWGRSRFLVGGGLLASALFVVGIVLFAISALLAPTCSRMQ